MNLKKWNRDNRSLLAVVGMLMILISLLNFSQIQHNVVLLGNELVKNNDISISIDSLVLVEKSLNGVKPSIIQKTIHLPIDINGNIELDEFPDKIGSGTIEDPYIIENYKIDGNYDDVPIKIQHTLKYLIIQNCEITRGNVEYSGIYICNSSHISIVNNTIENCLNSGIKIEKEIFENTPTDFLIKDNIIRNNDDNGISIFATNYVEILNNEIYFNEDNGIDLDYIYGNNEIANNQIKFNGYSGIYCSHNTSASIFLNIVENNTYGIRIWMSSVKIFSNNISYNEQDGLSVSDPLISDRSSDYSVIHDNLILENGLDGITLSSDYCSIYSNLIHYNKWNGIDIFEGSYNDIYSNDFIGDSINRFSLVYGIDISDSKSLRNNISDNSICGFDEMVNDEGTETHIEGNYCSNDTTDDTTDDTSDDTTSDDTTDKISGFSNGILFSCLGIGIFWLFKRKRNRIAWTESF